MIKGELKTDYGSELHNNTYTKTRSAVSDEDVRFGAVQKHIYQNCKCAKSYITTGSELHKTHVPKWRLSCKMNAMAAVRSSAKAHIPKLPLLSYEETMRFRAVQRAYTKIQKLMFLYN